MAQVYVKIMSDNTPTPGGFTLVVVPEGVDIKFAQEPTPTLSLSNGKEVKVPGKAYVLTPEGKSVAEFTPNETAVVTPVDPKPVDPVDPVDPTEPVANSVELAPAFFRVLFDGKNYWLKADFDHKTYLVTKKLLVNVKGNYLVDILKDKEIAQPGDTNGIELSQYFDDAAPIKLFNDDADPVVPFTDQASSAFYKFKGDYDFGNPDTTMIASDKSFVWFENEQYFQMHLDLVLPDFLNTMWQIGAAKAIQLYVGPEDARWYIQTVA